MEWKGKQVNLVIRFQVVTNTTKNYTDDFIDKCVFQREIIETSPIWLSSASRAFPYWDGFILACCIFGIFFGRGVDIYDCLLICVALRELVDNFWIKLNAGYIRCRDTENDDDNDHIWNPIHYQATFKQRCDEIGNKAGYLSYIIDFTWSASIVV